MHLVLIKNDFYVTLFPLLYMFFLIADIFAKNNPYQLKYSIQSN